MPGSITNASARRYAEAAYNVARETQDFDRWQSMLDELARVAQTTSAQAVFLNPTVSVDQKVRALNSILPGLPPMLQNFLTILVERGRMRNAGQIAEAFRERTNGERGILAVDVTTAIALDPEMERGVAERLGAYLRHDPQRLALRSHVDPNIIGGVVARVGDRLIDDSVRGRLERLKQALATGS